MLPRNGLDAGLGPRASRVVNHAVWKHDPISPGGKRPHYPPCKGKEVTSGEATKRTPPPSRPLSGSTPRTSQLATPKRGSAWFITDDAPNPGSSSNTDRPSVNSRVPQVERRPGFPRGQLLPPRGVPMIQDRGPKSPTCQAKLRLRLILSTQEFLSSIASAFLRNFSLSCGKMGAGTVAMTFFPICISLRHGASPHFPLSLSSVADPLRRPPPCYKKHPVESNTRGWLDFVRNLHGNLGFHELSRSSQHLNHTVSREAWQAEGTDYATKTIEKSDKFSLTGKL